jgi:hypothetical protein
MGDTASNGSGSYAPANWISLSTDAGAPNAANTTLPGEITGGTLARAQAAYAHTNGQATYTLTKTFTSDRTIEAKKMGIFTASAGGTLAFETLLDSTAALKSGDTLQVIETISI